MMNSSSRPSPHFPVGLSHSSPSVLVPASNLLYIYPKTIKEHKKKKLEEEAKEKRRENKTPK
jgi:hypothetical protein